MKGPTVADWEWWSNHVFGPALNRLLVPAGSPFGTVVGVLGMLAFGLVVFYLLNLLTPKGRKRLIVVVTFLGGLYYSLEFYIPFENVLSRGIEPLGNFFVVSGSFLIGLGLINLLIVHGRNILKAQKGYYNSVALFAGLLMMLGSVLWQSYAAKSQLAANVQTVLFFGFFAAMKATVFSILAFYIVSAAYRAFRVKTFEASIMMVAAVLVMLGQIPVGTWLTQGIHSESKLAFLRLENINTWIQLIPGTGASRGVLLGVAVGSLAITLRLWLSLEKGAFFEQEL
jgi:hypothetical protein